MVLQILLAFIVEWLDRKITGRIQRRYGPKYTGVFGILQPIADFIKLLSKEDLRLRSKEERLISILVISPSIILIFCFFFLPFPKILISFKGDLIFMIFLYSLVLLFFVLIGYLIPNPYSNLGAGRLLQMFVSFELLFIISIIPVVIVKNSITIKDIMEQNIPLVILLPISFFGYLVSSLAKLSFAPFDIPDAKTEIAEGWKCELSGRNIAMIRFCYNLELLFLSSFGALLFFGFRNFLSFLVEIFSIVLFLSILKNTTGRLRVDQAIYLLWRGAIPLSLIQLVITIGALP